MERVPPAAPRPHYPRHLASEGGEQTDGEGKGRGEVVLVGNLRFALSVRDTTSLSGVWEDPDVSILGWR